MYEYRRKFKTDIHGRIRFLSFLLALPFIIAALVGFALFDKDDLFSFILPIGGLIVTMAIFWLMSIVVDLVVLSEEKAVLLEHLLEGQRTERQLLEYVFLRAPEEVSPQDLSSTHSFESGAPVKPKRVASKPFAQGNLK